MAILKKDKKFESKNILSNSIRGVLKALKSLLLFPSILLPRGIGSRQNRTVPYTIERATSFHQGVIWYDQADGKLSAQLSNL